MEEIVTLELAFSATLDAVPSPSYRARYHSLSRLKDAYNYCFNCTPLKSVAFVLFALFSPLRQLGLFVYEGQRLAASHVVFIFPSSFAAVRHKSLNGKQDRTTCVLSSSRIILGHRLGSVYSNLALN